MGGAEAGRTRRLSIGQVAEQVGLPVSTVRYYDDIGLVPATDRAGGQRSYEPGALRRLAAVQLCQQAGFTLDEIAELLDRARPDGHWHGLARRKLEQLDARMARLRRARRLVERALACGCAHLEGCDRDPDLAVQLAELEEPPAPQRNASRRL